MKIIESGVKHHNRNTETSEITTIAHLFSE